MKRNVVRLFASVLFAGCFVLNAARGQTNLVWDPGTAQGGTEIFTNSSTAAGSYLFAVTTQTTPNSVGFWRSVLKVDSGEANLYTSTSSSVSTNYYTYRSEETGSDSIVQSLSPGQTWYILVEAQAGAQWSLFAGDVHVTELTWDPGTAEAGSEVFTNLDTDGGAYYFKLTTQAPALDTWRTALEILSGEADLYIRQNALPYVNSLGHAYTDSSTLAGDDGFLRYLSHSSGAGQVWYILVQSDAGATWSLLSGEVYVEDLGALAADGSSGSGLKTIPPEGTRYFKTTIPADALAWRLWLQDSTGTNTLNNHFYIRHGYNPYLAIPLTSTAASPARACWCRPISIPATPPPTTLRWKGCPANRSASIPGSRKSSMQATTTRWRTSRPTAFCSRPTAWRCRRNRSPGK